MGIVSSADELPEVPGIQVKQAPFGDEVAEPATASSAGYQEASASQPAPLCSKSHHLEAFEKQRRAVANNLKTKGRKLRVPLSWARRPVNYRLFGVLRHAERADMLGSRVNGESWTLLEESKDFPIDPPLSDHGQQEAARVAVTVRTFADRNGSELHVVVSSLYLRCVETAIQVCKQLGPATKLILDHSLGEVFGHAVLGDQKPLTTWHSPSYLVRYARSQGVRIVKKVCGKVPVWPETLRMARMRYASTFLGYLRRSEICRRNFVLVSHADCIASVLAIIPSKAGRIVESVSTGASVLGLRSLDPRKTPKVYHVDEGASEDSDPPARSTKGGWTVELNGVQMGPRWRNGETASRAAQRALQGNGNFVLSARALEGLLGGLSQEPLGDRSPKGTKRSEISQDAPESSLLSPGGSEQSTFGDGASCCSSSTMLFGASETGSEYDISPTSPRTDGDFDMLKPHTFCAAESIQRPNSTGGLMNNDAVRRSRFLTTEFSGTLSSVRGSSVRSSSAGRVTLQGCNGSAILARRRNMAGN